jgi:hypothetical protein
MSNIVIVDYDDIHPLTITDQQWLDHTNQNNQEFANRQILLKDNGPPSNTNTPAPFGSFYKDKSTGDRYEQVEVDPGTNGYDWQLFTGNSTIIVDRSKSLLDVRDCDSTLAEGDLVYESTTTASYVDEVVDNTDTRLVIGICTKKISSTSAEILFKGPLTGLSGYNAGKKIYCSSTGVMTSVLPTTGYIQVIGNTSNGTHIDFSPAMHQVKRTT